MTVYVSFFTPAGIGSIDAPGISRVRVRESLALNATTTAALAAGEVAYVVNAEPAAVFVAFGTTPDAIAAASTSATSAGVGIPAGGVLPIVGAVGDRINVKAGN